MTAAVDCDLPPWIPPGGQMAAAHARNLAKAAAAAAADTGGAGGAGDTGAPTLTPVPASVADPVTPAPPAAESVASEPVTPEPEPGDREGEAEREPKPFIEQYTDVPRDILSIWANGSRFAKLRHVDDPAARRSGKGLSKEEASAAVPVSRSWLYATIARCADIKTGLAIVRPETIAAASGISLRTLQDEFAHGNKHFLSPFITRVFQSNPKEHWYNTEGHVVWKFEVTPVDKRNSLHTPPWWLWQEPEPGAKGPDRLRRRVDAEGKPLWNPNSPALIVCWGIAHVGKEFRITDTYGITGISTITGLSPRHVQTGYRDAVNWGMLTRDGGPGGAKTGVNTLRLHPGDPMGALPSGEQDHLF